MMSSRFVVVEKRVWRIKHYACQSMSAVTAHGAHGLSGFRAGLCVVRVMPNRNNFVHEKGLSALRRAGRSDKIGNGFYENGEHAILPEACG